VAVQASDSRQDHGRGEGSDTVLECQRPALSNVQPALSSQG